MNTTPKTQFVTISFEVTNVTANDFHDLLCKAIHEQDTDALLQLGNTIQDIQVEDVEEQIEDVGSVKIATTECFKIKR